MNPVEGHFICCLCAKRGSPQQDKERLRAQWKKWTLKHRAKTPPTTVTQQSLSEPTKKEQAMNKRLARAKVKEDREKSKAAKKALREAKKKAKEHLANLRESKRKARENQIFFHLSGCFTVEKDVIRRFLLKDKRFTEDRQPTDRSLVVIGSESPLKDFGRPINQAQKGTVTTLEHLFSLWNSPSDRKLETSDIHFELEKTTNIRLNKTLVAYDRQYVLYI
jgi:hypothetical protein